MAGTQDNDQIALAQAGNTAAMDRLLRQYEPMVWKLTRRTLKRLRGVDEDDLAQEGRMGVYRAISEYDASRGASLTTHCYNHIHWALGKFTRKKDDPLLSLDAPYGDDEDGGKLLDAVEDHREEAPLESLGQAEENEMLHWAIGCLPEKYAAAVSRHMDDKKLSDVGLEIGVSGERVRQLEVKAKRIVALLVSVKSGKRTSYTLDDAEREYISLAIDHKPCGTIARELGRSHATVKAHLQRTTRFRRCGILWLPQNVQILRAHKHQPWTVAAQKLGTTVTAVRSAAARLGLEKDYGPIDEQEFRRLHALGWSTGELAQHFKRAGWTMACLQKKLGLPSNAHNERWRNSKKRIASCSKVAAKKKARDSQRAWHLVGRDWPLGAAIVYHVIRWHGCADRQLIAERALAFSRRHGWHPSVTEWHGALAWAKWLKDRGYVTEYGAGCQLRQYEIRIQGSEVNAA